MFRSPFMLPSSLPFVLQVKALCALAFLRSGNVDDLNFGMTEFEI